MQVFRTYFKLLKSQLISIIMYAVIFLTITIAISVAIIGSDEGSFQIKEVPIAVMNRDGENALIQGMLEYLDQYVDYYDIEDTEEARKDALFFRRVLYIMEIPEGFTEDLLAGREVKILKVSVPDAAEVVSVDNAINNYLNKATVYLKHVPDTNPEDLNEYILSNRNKNTEVTFVTKQSKKDINANEFNRNYYNYLAYVLLAAFISGVSSVMVSFHNVDIRRRQNASPVSVRSMNMQLILANFVFVIVYLALFLVAGYIVNPFRFINRHLLLYVINAIVFTVTALSISYLIGITVKNKNAVSALSTVISLSFSFLSGVFVDQQFLGKAVQKVASFMPTYWYVRANNEINAVSSLSMSNLSDVFLYLAIELGFAVVIFAIAMVVSKRKQQIA